MIPATIAVWDDKMCQAAEIGVGELCRKFFSRGVDTGTFPMMPMLRDIIPLKLVHTLVMCTIFWRTLLIHFMHLYDNNYP